MSSTKNAWSHPALWILAPLALSVLYAVFHALAGPRPTAGNVVPADAILTQRFQNLEAIDRAFLRPPDDPIRASERVAAQRNLAGWVGVDRERPFFVAILPRKNRPDSSVFIVPLKEADALEARFQDPEFFLTKKQIRQPQHLGISGDWAAIAWDADTVGRLGGGGLVAEDLGETWSVIIDLPRLVDFALAAPGEEPWATLLRGLGFEPVSGHVEGGDVAVKARRVLRIREAWGQIALWAFFDEHRLRVDLLPRAPALLRALEAAVEAGKTEARPAVPAPPLGAEAFLRIPTGAARAALARAVHLSGVDLPVDLDDAATRLGRPEGPGVLLWAAPAPNHPAFWTLGLAGADGSIAPFLALHPALPREPQDVTGWSVMQPEPAILRADPSSEAPLPTIETVRRRQGDVDVLLFGPDVRRALQRFDAKGSRQGTGDAPLTPPKGFVELATFGWTATRAQEVLGLALREGGLFAPLEGGDIQGSVWTDGKTIRIEARRRVPDD